MHARLTSGASAVNAWLSRYQSRQRQFPIANQRADLRPKRANLFRDFTNGGGARIGWRPRVIPINSIVPTGTIELRKNGKHARRKPGTPLWFRKCADDKRAGFWNLIEIREQFDLVVIGAQNVGLE